MKVGEIIIGPGEFRVTEIWNSVPLGRYIDFLALMCYREISSNKKRPVCLRAFWNLFVRLYGCFPELEKLRFPHGVSTGRLGAVDPHLESVHQISRFLQKGLG